MISSIYSEIATGPEVTISLVVGLVALNKSISWLFLSVRNIISWKMVDIFNSWFLSDVLNSWFWSDVLNSWLLSDFNSLRLSVNNSLRLFDVLNSWCLSVRYSF